MNITHGILILYTWAFLITYVRSADVAPNGYLLFCPCMGRFGNQVETYLGTIGFAKKLNRTLVLAPWVEYRKGESKSVQVPFTAYFQLKPLLHYLNVITMEDFMTNLAPKIWPVGNRTVFCYMERSETKGCNAKHGNPFGPFWDTYSIDFNKSEFFQPLYYSSPGKEWNEKYNVTQHPVMAFVSSPATFPIQKEHVHLQQYLVWNDNITLQAKSYIKNKLPKGPFVGIHLRNGPDWYRACEHIEQGTRNLFSSPQCLGYDNENGVASYNMCLPTKDTIIKQLKKTVTEIGAKSVFVASDHNHMLSELSSALRKYDCSVHKLEESNPHLELAILGQSNHFIGNCISSFTAFVKRERDVFGFPSSFWDFSSLHRKVSSDRGQYLVHGEL